MIKKLKKILRKTGLAFDYAIFGLVFIFCFAGLVFALPWIFKQRRIWYHSAKGNPKALFLREFNLNHIKTFGHESFLAHTPLSSYQNASIKWIGFLDPVHSEKTKIKITDDLYLMTLKSPQIVQILKNFNLPATSTIVREIFAVFKITAYCASEKIGVMFAYKHDYSALRAYVVWRFIKIPYIVDIMTNFELIRRLGGRRYYFARLHKLPIIGTFAPALTNWLLGLPLRHAFHVLGRNKNNYEHAFALGAPVERLSLIRIRNYNTAYNSFDPEKLPPKPADFPYLLFVGRLSEIKLPFDVIDAFDLAAADLTEYRLVIIGDGDIRDKVEERRLRSEYKHRIKLLGECSSDIVFNWTSHASIAICPYSGSTLVEPMLCGIPIIAYDIEWHAEIIHDDYTGYLVPFRNIEALAEKIKYVASHYEEAKSVAMRGRELANAVFDKVKIQEKERIIYQDALAK